MTERRAKKDGGIARAFLKYRDVLTGALLRLSVQPSDVDDILQEALARALEADGKDEIRHPKSYLFQIARNMVFREHQRRAREVQGEIDEAILESSDAPTDESVHYKQMLRAFWEAMETLPKAQRRAILLRRLYGLTQRQVAEKMGVSVSSVEKYFAQGMRQCQAVMKARGFELEGASGALRQARRHAAHTDRKDGSHE